MTFFEAIEGLVGGIWYHGTNVTSAKIILHDGYLRPRQETNQQGATGFTPSVPGNVYLTQRINVAVQAAYWKGRYNEYGDGAYVFTVTSDDLSEIQADEDFPYFVITNNPVARDIPEKIQNKIRKLAGLSKKEIQTIGKRDISIRDRLVNLSKDILAKLAPTDHLAMINSVHSLAHVGKIPYSECWYVPWIIQPQPNYLHANDVIKTRSDLEQYGKRIK